ncbi:WhiB family transcriptional regulator [Streptomyces sp. NPDC088725]|uniref:WhiB family transcriptional regulator n=1 Tax=Streptomyces sp. NPDC088725 TaxID=3365873 RepID=UPI003815FF5E
MRHITTHSAPATGLRGIGDTSWHNRGVCHGMDPEDADAVFFPLPRDHEAIAEAKELCGLCPVRRDCLNYALENALKEGIWGGLTDAERRPWHDGLPQRLDYTRVSAFFNGRDVHLTESERQVVIDHAYVRGWRPDRLAAALQISHKHARDLLRQSANKVLDRDRTYGVPRPKKKRTKAAQTKGGPKPTKPGTSQPVSRPVTRPVTSTSAHAPLGKAA